MKSKAAMQQKSIQEIILESSLTTTDNTLSALNNTVTSLDSRLPNLVSEIDTTEGNLIMSRL